MIFDHGFYHADPHPGNLMVMEGCRIGLLDFGMVGRIDERLHEDVSEMLVALSNLDAEHMTAMILRLGKTPADLDRSALSLDVADFLSYYASQSLDKFDLSGALNEMMEQIRRYHIMLPARIAMLLKALITLEGTARLVSPKFNLVEMIRPYRRKLLWRRFSPRRRLRKLHRLYSELEHLVDILPQGIADILEQMQSGRFDIHLDHRGLEPSVNRLVLGMLASALFVGSSLLLSRGVPPLINLPLLPEISAPGAGRGRREHRPGVAALAGDQQVGPPRSEEEELTPLANAEIGFVGSRPKRRPSGSTWATCTCGPPWTRTRSWSPASSSASDRPTTPAG